MHERRGKKKTRPTPSEPLEKDIISGEVDLSFNEIATIEQNVCDVCHLTNFKTSAELKEHLKSVHLNKDTIYACGFCPSDNLISFPKKIQLRIHERKVHQKQVKPKLIKKGTTILNVSKNHQICEICQYECISKSALEKHILTHTKERPHQCPECNKRFVQSSHVNYHMKTVHAPPDTFRPKNHACTECGARFGTASTLRKHFRTHTGKHLILYAEL